MWLAVRGNERVAAAAGEGSRSAFSTGPRRARPSAAARDAPPHHARCELTRAVRCRACEEGPAAGRCWLALPAAQTLDPVGGRAYARTHGVCLRHALAHRNALPAAARSLLDVRLAQLRWEVDGAAQAGLAHPARGQGRRDDGRPPRAAAASNSTGLLQSERYACSARRARPRCVVSGSAGSLSAPRPLHRVPPERTALGPTGLVPRPAQPMSWPAQGTQDGGIRSCPRASRRAAGQGRCSRGMRPDHD